MRGWRKFPDLSWRFGAKSIASQGVCPIDAERLPQVRENAGWRVRLFQPLAAFGVEQVDRVQVCREQQGFAGLSR
jgi:hypothetical protein